MATSALHPQGRGKIEKLVGIIKMMMKRILATKEDYNWENLPYICAKAYNSSISPRTGFRPDAMLFGTDNICKSFPEVEIAPPHFLVKNNKIHLESISKDIRSSALIAKEKLSEIRLAIQEKVNKTRIEPIFKVNDIVFNLDTRKIPGATRPLKLKLSNSPFVVLKVLPVTCLVKRLSDGFTALYAKDDLKIYNKVSPLFRDLPIEIKHALIYSFEDFLSTDFSTIAKYDDLDLPNGIPLMDKELLDQKLVTDPDMEDDIKNDIEDIKYVEKEEMDDDENECWEDKLSNDQQKEVTFHPDTKK